MYTVFLSAYREDAKAIVNMASHTVLCRAVERLFDMKPTQVAGRYNGRDEASIRVNADCMGEVFSLCNLAVDVFKQECILVIDNDDRAYLMGHDYKMNAVGTIKRMSSSTVPEDFKGDFSFDGEYVWALG